MTNPTDSLIDETGGQMLERLGTDGMLWAQEMNKHFPSVSVADFLGWCCNMIEAGGDRERRRANKPVMSDPVAYVRDLDGTGSLHICTKGDPGSKGVKYVD